MARHIPIISVNRSSGPTPGTIVIGTHPDNVPGNWVSSFHGRYYRNAAGATLPGYTTPAPVGYTLIDATVFYVEGNASYGGRYTVYTPIDVADAATHPSSSFTAGATTIRVNEPIGDVLPTAPGDAVGVGNVTNTSTYYIAIPTDPAVIVPPAVALDTHSLEFVGRGYTGWGEVFQQNLAHLAQNFSAPKAPNDPTAPAGPRAAFIGQAWYNPANAEFSIWDGTAWHLLNYTKLSPTQSYSHRQTTAATVWNVTYSSLDAIPFPTLAFPYVVHHTFFAYVNEATDDPITPLDPGQVSGRVYRQILPWKVEYLPTGLKVSFSTPYAGIVLYRP